MAVEKGPTPKGRNLIKYDQINLKMTETELFSLEDSKLEKFDQFKNKTSTYDFEKYTSSFDKSKITNEQRKIAS